MIRTVIHSLGVMALAGIFLLVPVMAFAWSCPVGSPAGINSTVTMTGVGGGAIGVGNTPAVSGSAVGPAVGGGAAGLPPGGGGKDPNAKPAAPSPTPPGGMGLRPDEGTRDADGHAGPDHAGRPGDGSVRAGGFPRGRVPSDKSGKTGTGQGPYAETPPR